MLGIEGLLDRKPAQLSGGQRQRVALGRAMVRDSQVFLLDEPLGNLDAKLREQVRYELKKLQVRLGVTTVYVTHDQTEAMTLADQIVLMKDGRIVQQGAPRDIYDYPKDLFAATFIGSPKINTFECVIRKSANGFIYETENFSLPVSAEALSLIGKTANDTVLLGVRPPDFVLCKPHEEGTHPRSPDSRSLASLEPRAGDDGAIAGIIDGVESLGDAALVYLKVGKDVIVAKTVDADPGKPGEKLTLRIPMEKLHVFDRETSLRLGMPQCIKPDVLAE
jgi:multiple sugar transport system ATP-binding protein